MFFTRRIRDDSLHSKNIQICLTQSIRHRNQVVRIDLLEIILFHYGSTKSKTIWNTYIEKTKCRNLRHRIIGIDVTCSKLLRMLLILLGFLSTVNICYQESESVIPIVSRRKYLTSVKSVSLYNLFHKVMYSYLRNISRFAKLSVYFFTLALNSSFSFTLLFLDLESSLTAASA